MSVKDRGEKKKRRTRRKFIHAEGSRGGGFAQRGERRGECLDARGEYSDVHSGGTGHPGQAPSSEVGSHSAGEIEMTNF